MLPQNGLTVRLNLAEGDRLHASALKPKAEATDAAEEVQNFQARTRDG